MNKIISLILLFLGVSIAFTACKKDEAGPILDTNATVSPTWITIPSPDTHFVLEEDTINVVVTTLEWSEVVYALPDLPSPLYTIQMFFTADSTVESSWGEPIELFTLPETNRDITTNELNTAILKEIGTDFPEDTVISVAFQIKANVNSNDVANTIDAFTAIAPFSVTPFVAAVPGGASLWVPGNHQGWDPAVAPQIWDADGDNVFEGFVYFPEDGFNGEFKFTGNPAWVDDENYGAGATPGSLDNDSGAGNLLVPEFGGYWLVADLNAMTWTYTAQNWGVIGSGILAGDWSEDVDIIPAVGGPLNILEATVDVIEPPDGSELRFKFRADDGWTLNYGAEAGSNVLISGGPDIPMPEGPGNYTFKMNMSMPEFTYEFSKN